MHHLCKRYAYADSIAFKGESSDHLIIKYIYVNKSRVKFNLWKKIGWEVMALAMTR